MNDSQSLLKKSRRVMMNKAWFYVGMTSFFELVWILGLNIATDWWHWVIIISCIIVDFYFLTKACQGLPTGTVYAVFAGVGTVGTALLDVFFFGGSLSFGKIIFIIILVLGVVGINIADKLDEEKALKGIA